MKRYYKYYLLPLCFLIICTLTACTAVTSKQNDVQQNIDGQTQQNASDKVSMAKFNIDRKKAATLEVTAKSGGVVSMQLEERINVDIVFFADAVEKDMSYKVYPVTSLPEDDTVISRGFYIEPENGGNMPALTYPAIIRFVFDDSLPGEASIVRYSDDGKNREPVRTNIAKHEGKTCLTAEVMGFSGYGVGTPTRQQIEAMADQQEEKGFDWVVEIDERKDNLISADGTKYTMIFKMNVVNKSGIFLDAFKGEAFLTIVGVKDVGGPIPAAAGLELKDANVEFALLAPLIVPATDDGMTLAPLVEKDWTSGGIFKFALTYVGFMGLEEDVDEGEETDTPDFPYEISVYGPRAVVTLDIPGYGKLDFIGKLIGHGKRSPDTNEQESDTSEQDSDTSDSADPKDLFNKVKENFQEEWENNGGDDDVDIAPLVP